MIRMRFGVGLSGSLLGLEGYESGVNLREMGEDGVLSWSKELQGMFFVAD